MEMDGERNGGSKINGVMMPLCSRSKAFMTDITYSSLLVLFVMSDCSQQACV